MDQPTNNSRFGAGKLALLVLGMAMVAGGFSYCANTDRDPVARTSTVKPLPGRISPPAASSRTAVARVPEPVVATIRARRAGNETEDPVRRRVADVFPALGAVPPDWRRSHPAEVTISVFPGLELTFAQRSVSEESGTLTWVGRNPDLPGASLVGVATSNGYDAILLVPGASQFNFHVRGDEVLVEEYVTRRDDCAHFPAVAAGSPPPVSSGVHYAEAANTGGGQLSLDETPTRSASSHAGHSDVLFVYSAEALALAQSRSSDPLGYLDGFSRAALATCNAVLENSQIAEFRWRYLGITPAPPFTLPGPTVIDALRVIQPEGPLDGFVQQVRAQYGADQVLMWIGAGDRKGAAFAGPARHLPALPTHVVAVLRLTAPTLVLAHELAHNFGCHHNRENAGSGDGFTSTPPGDGYWSYGLLWNDPTSPGVEASTSGTAMAYADWVVPYFSNPNLTVQVTSTMQGRPGEFRDLGTRTLGFPENHPHAAYNTRILRENAAAIVSGSPEAVNAPAIATQPSNATLATGQTLTLAVAATGRELGYQWFKDDTAIAGATSLSYTKSFVAADAGQYSVRVTNPAGNVTSRTAAISAATAPAPNPPVPTPSPQQGGGGGGGGAPSAWSAGLLGALLLIRRLRRAR